MHFPVGSACNRLIPSWPLLLGLASLVRPLLQPTRLLNDPDTYLHIAAGRWMLAHGKLPTIDPFSHSLPNATWIPHEWAAEIIFALTFWVAGWHGIVLLIVASFAVSIAIFCRLLLRHFEPF